MAEHHTAAHPCHSRGSFPLLLAEALSDHPTTTTTITATQHHPNTTTTTTTRPITIPYNPNTKLTHNQQKFKSKSTKIQTNFNRKSQTHFTSTQKTHVRIMGEIKRDYCCRLDRKSDLPINIQRSKKWSLVLDGSDWEREEDGASNWERGRGTTMVMKVSREKA